MYIYIYIVCWPTVVESDTKVNFSIATTPKFRGEHYSFLWIAWLTIDPYLILMTVKQGGKYDFLNLWYDSTLDWTPVSRAIGNTLPTMLTYIYIYIYISLSKNKTGHIRIIDLFPPFMCFFIKQKNMKKINRTTSDLMDKINQNRHRKGGWEEERRRVKSYLLI